VKFKLKVPDTALFDVNKAKRLFQNDFDRYLDDSLSYIQANIKSEAPVFDGLMRDTIHTERDNLIGRVVSGVDYAVAVNEGRRPGKTPPPSSALIGWISRSAKGRSWFSKLKASNPNITLSSAAYILARSIGRKGFKNDFWDRGADKSERRVKLNGEKLLKKITEGLVK
jgi:hypothetical protein